MSKEPLKPRISSDTEDQEDLALLRRIVERDREAFKALYLRHYDGLLRFIYGMTGSMDCAQEGINDVMLVVWNKAQTFAGRSRLRTWIMGIAYRKALKLAESNWRWQTRFKSVEVTDWNEPSDELSEPSRKVEGVDALAFGLSRLSAKQRAVVELTFRYGYSYDEIAAIVNCPVNTVKTRMFHARATLKRIAPELYE
jgi:RNA polymerase sigma-70 factor (ECF subfamily)